MNRVVLILALAILFGLCLTNCGSSRPYNPYLGSKDDDKPSAVIANEYKRGAKKGAKRFKRQLRKNKKKVYSK